MVAQLGFHVERNLFRSFFKLDGVLFAISGNVLFRSAGTE
jgi:hypothetical protein